MRAVEIKFDRSNFISGIEKLVLNRYSEIEDIQDSIRELTGLRTTLEQGQVDEDAQEFDFCLISNCEVNGEDLCFLDIYYVYDNGGRMLITEVGYIFNT